MSSEFRSVLTDRQSIFEYALAVALVYLGYDLVRIILRGRNIEFEILVPQFDLDDLQKSYNNASMSVSDVRAFGQTYSQVSRLVKDARRDGVYVNPDFRELLADEAAAGCC